MEMVLEGIGKSFGSKNVLRGIDFTFEQGKIYGLLGRNGAGKTTLFNCLSGETKPDAGKMTLLQGEKAAPLQPEQVGYAFATPILPDFLTGYEFVKFFLDVNQSSLSAAQTPEAYLEMVQIQKEDWHRLIKGYSHGMKNKLQMLCFLIARPPVVLLDEPMTSLDVVVSLEIKKILRGMKDAHILMLSTHILQLAVDLCDEIVLLQEGRLQLVDRALIHEPQFEERIVELLKEETAQ